MAALGPRPGADAASAETGFEDLVRLAKSALPDPKKDKDGKVAEMVALYRGYLGAVTPDRREAPVLCAARHALCLARESGRPSLGGYACKIIIGTMMPKLIDLCHPDLQSYSAVVTPCHDNGLFANMLQVLDALVLSRPEAEVLVDWRRKGSEAHFQYGPATFDLWAHLFGGCKRCHSVADSLDGGTSESTLVLKSRVSPVFLSMLRGYFWTLPELPALRSAYASASACLKPTAAVAARVDELCTAWAGGCAVGVHKRLGTPEVSACQLSQRNPASAEYVARARKVALASSSGSAANGRRPVVFLATDDLHAVQVFQDAFPPEGDIELHVRSGVKRSEGGVRADGVDNEVHRSPCEVADAEDVLIDAFCLARCQDLVCIDSNVSIFVALRNPEIRLHPLNSILPEGWEEAAAHPDEAVHAAYRVIFSPMVFVRGGPSAACELMGARKPGDIVRTTGRGFDGWIEIEEGGWMLVDGERQAQGRGQGMLLEAVTAEEAT